MPVISIKPPEKARRPPANRRPKPYCTAPEPDQRRYNPRSTKSGPAAYHRSNGYIISEQGKPPDFVLEIASPSTGQIDVTDKRDDYADARIREYWRFDETGRYHGRRLAGDRAAHCHLYRRTGRAHPRRSPHPRTGSRPI